MKTKSSILDCLYRLHIRKPKSTFLALYTLHMLAALLFAICPVLMAILGSKMHELITRKPCHEGNCIWVAFIWLTFLTLPIGGIFFIKYAIRFMRLLFSKRYGI